MSLAAAAPIGFIPTGDAEAAREFYQITLGLHFVQDDGFALVFRLGTQGSMLRVVRVESFTPLPFTLFGWEVDDLQSEVQDLQSKGVAFLRFDSLQQDAHGIWTAPGGHQIAWFKDPGGNTLSLSSHVRPA